MLKEFGFWFQQLALIWSQVQLCIRTGLNLIVQVVHVLRRGIAVYDYTVLVQHAFVKNEILQEGVHQSVEGS